LDGPDIGGSGVQGLINSPGGAGGERGDGERERDSVSEPGTIVWIHGNEMIRLRSRVTHLLMSFASMDI
jgi:hypothetical protein